MEPLFAPATSFPGWLTGEFYRKALSRTVHLIAALPDHALPVGLRSQYHLLHHGDRPLYHQLYRAETFIQNAAPLAGRYGLPPPVKIIPGMRNRLLDRPMVDDYRSLYTPSLITMTAQRYRRDIDAFGYQNELEQLLEHATRSGQPHQLRTGNHNASSSMPEIRYKTPKIPSKASMRKIVGSCTHTLHAIFDDARRLLQSTPERPWQPQALSRSILNPRLLYLPNPKCASSTIYMTTPWEFLPLGRSLRISLKQISDQDGQPPFCFSFVRNPFERLTSCYADKILQNTMLSSYHSKCNFHVILYDIFGYQKWPASFEDFVYLVCTTPDYLADAHFRSQYAALHENGEPLAQYIGKVENFTNDMRYLSERFGIPVPASKKNTSPDYDWRNLYTPDLVELVAERYDQDFKSFGYEKEVDDLLRYTRGVSAPP